MRSTWPTKPWSSPISILKSGGECRLCRDTWKLKRGAVRPTFQEKQVLRCIMCKIVPCQYSLQHCEAIERGKETNHPASPVDKNTELFILSWEGTWTGFKAYHLCLEAPCVEDLGLDSRPYWTVVCRIQYQDRQKWKRSELWQSLVLALHVCQNSL